MARHSLLWSSLSGLFACSCIVAVAAQQPKPTFEVTSVKRNVSARPAGFGNVQPGGRFVATNTPLTRLVQFAFGIRKSNWRVDRIG